MLLFVFLDIVLVALFEIFCQDHVTVLPHSLHSSLKNKTILLFKYRLMWERQDSNDLQRRTLVKSIAVISKWTHLVSCSTCQFSFSYLEILLVHQDLESLSSSCCSWDKNLSLPWSTAVPRLNLLYMFTTSWVWHFRKHNWKTQCFIAQRQNTPELARLWGPARPWKW